MATNEIYKYGDWLTVPVPADAVPGDPIAWGAPASALIPGVIQVLYKPALPDVPGYITVPPVPNGNEDGSALGDQLMPADSVFGSVAFRGVWAFDIEDADPATTTIGDPVFFVEGTDPTPGTLSMAAGTGIFGHVHNVDYNGNIHVRLAAVLLPSA